MRWLGRPVLWLAALLLAACRTAPAQEALPAVLTNPGTAVRQELVDAIKALSGFASITLADTDLTRSSELVIERTHQRSAQGDLLQGRDLEAPQRFHLLMQDGQCWLLHQPSGKRQLLMQAHCKALSTPALPAPQ